MEGAGMGAVHGRNSLYIEQEVILCKKFSPVCADRSSPPPWGRLNGRCGPTSRRWRPDSVSNSLFIPPIRSSPVEELQGSALGRSGMLGLVVLQINIANVPKSAKNIHEIGERLSTLGQCVGTMSDWTITYMKDRGRLFLTIKADRRIRRPI